MTKTKWEADWLISQAFCQLLPWKPSVCCCLFCVCCVCVMVYVCACTPVEARGQSWPGVVSQKLTKNASLAAQGAPRISRHPPMPTALGLQACPEISIFTWVPKLARHAFFQRSHFSSPRPSFWGFRCVYSSHLKVLNAHWTTLNGHIYFVSVHHVSFNLYSPPWQDFLDCLPIHWFYYWLLNRLLITSITFLIWPWLNQMSSQSRDIEQITHFLTFSLSVQ